MKQLELAGTHFDIGFRVGEIFRREIQHIVHHHPDLNETLLPLFKTHEGRRFYEKFASLHRVTFPDFWDELRGIASGAGCDMELLFLLNLRGEYAPISAARDLAGCTTCTLKTDEGFILGHNEDAAKMFQDFLYLAHVKPKGKPGFLTLSYPGFLFGNAAGVNDCGVFFTVNITALRNPDFGMGRCFTARALLEAQDMQRAFGILADSPRSSGFNYTPADLEKCVVWNVEVISDQLHIRTVHDSYVHTNHYIDISDVDHIVTPSSHYRLKTGQRLIRELTNPGHDDLLRILGDESQPDYPIYRRAATPDETQTLVTLHLDLNRRNLRLITGNPFSDIIETIDVKV